MASTAELLQTNFNSGEWTPELAGRVDLAKYANSCATLKNFIPKEQFPYHSALTRAPNRSNFRPDN